MKVLFAIAMLSALLAGCIMQRQYGPDKIIVAPGMTEQQVVNLIGEPECCRNTPSGRRACSYEDVDVIFKNGRVQVLSIR